MLMKATGGYFPLLQKFRFFCEKKAQVSATEFYPGSAHVEQFRKELTGPVLREVLLSALQPAEISVLKRLFEAAKQFGDALLPKVECNLAYDFLFDDAKSEEELNEALNAAELLVNLDLMTHQDEAGIKKYGFENASLLNIALID